MNKNLSALEGEYIRDKLFKIEFGTELCNFILDSNGILNEYYYVLEVLDHLKINP
jgi:hypothetical protein